MLDYMVVEKQADILGVSPAALHDVLELLKEKITGAKTEFDDLEA